MSLSSGRLTWSETETWRITIGLTWCRTALRISRLKDVWLIIVTDYDDHPKSTPDLLTLSPLTPYFRLGPRFNKRFGLLTGQSVPILRCCRTRRFNADHHVLYD